MPLPGDFVIASTVMAKCAYPSCALGSLARIEGWVRSCSPANPKVARSMEISLSSENRSIRRNTLESDVPPLNRNSGSTRALVVQFFFQTSDSEQDSVEESLWPGWTSWNINVDGHDVVDAPQRGVVLAKDTATDAAGTNRNHDFRFWHSLVGFQQGQLHIPGDRPGDQEHVGVPRRGDKLNAEAFQVVDRIVQGNDFEFTSVA